MVKDGRRLAREAAEKHGDAYGRLSAVFAAAANPSSARALDRLGQASEAIGEADGQAAVALEDIGEYIEVVKGNAPGGGGSTSATSGGSTSGGFNPAPHLRDMPPFPGADRKTHGRTVGKGGKVEQVVSGELDPETRELDPRYVEGVKLARRLGLVPAKGKLTAAGDVELKWALQMRKDEVKRSHVAINNTDGPCEGSRSCDALLPVWLKEDSELTVHWQDEQGNDRSRKYKGARDEWA